MRDLTPEEQAILNEVNESARTPPTPKFGFDDKQQRIILAALLQYTEVSDLFRMVQSQFFSNEAHVLIYKCLKGYWDKMKHLPPRVVLEDLVIAELADREDSVKLHYHAELMSVYDYYTEGMPTNVYIAEKILEFCRIQRTRFGLQNLQEGKSYFESRDMLQLAFNEADTYVRETKLCKGLQQVFDSATNEDWCIENWLEFGSLAMLAGYSFAGKSAIICEFIAALLKHGTFGRYEVPRSAVLVVDAENKARIFKKRIEKALGEGESEDAFRLLQYVGPLDLPFPMPQENAPDILRSIIREAKKNTGEQKIVVIIDTLRSVLACDEMEGKQMTDILYPLQRLAQEENAAILILHHRPKSGAEYSGGTQVVAALDYQWLWESDFDTKIGKLSLPGTRGEHQDAMKFKLRDGRNCWIEDAENGKLRVSEKESALTEMLEHILRNGEMKQSEVIKAVQNQWNDGVCPGINKIRDIVSSMVGSVIVSRKGDNNSMYYSLMG